MLPTVPLGRLLIDTGILSQETLEEILAAQRTGAEKKRLGEILVERGLVRPAQLAQLLSHQLSCPWVSLDKVQVPPSVLGLVPREIALAHALVPVHVRVTNDTTILYVATDDPTDEVGMATCARAAGVTVRPMVALTEDVKSALRRLYGAGDEPPEKETIRVARAAPPREDDVDLALEDDDVIDIVEPTRVDDRPTIVALAAPDGFLHQCRGAAASLDATLAVGGITDAADLVAKHRPCAIVVTEEVYAFDRSRLSNLALDNDAVLVVWSEDADERQLELLLAGAVKRWRRAAYAKDAVVDGRYELLRDLGGAVGGSLWEVRHARTGRRGVLKIGVRTRDADETAQVQREQLALARVVHPGVVDLRDAGTTDLGDPYVVLEPLEGRTLEGLVAARGRLAPSDATAIAIGVADVLAAAHGASVFHGAVRPEHVVVVRDDRGLERTKLTGWEQARVLEEDGDERRDALAADARALATCLFEAIAGRKPRAGESIELGEAPAALSDVIARALRGPRDERFDSMNELAEAIADAVPAARDGSRVLEASRRERGKITSAEPPPPGPEQRRAARAAYRTPVRVAVPGVGPVDGRSEDVSAGGLLVMTRAAVAAGLEVTIRFALPLDGKVIAEGAVVRWSRAARGGEGGVWAVGLELMSPAPETVRQIERYVSLMGVAEERDEP